MVTIALGHETKISSPPYCPEILTAPIGVVTDEATTLYPSLNGDTAGMIYRSRRFGDRFEVTHEGDLVEPHKFGNYFGVVGVDREAPASAQNTLIGTALENQLEGDQHIGDAFKQIVPRLRGVFSIIARSEDSLYVARDRRGEQISMFIGALTDGGHAVSSNRESVERMDVTDLIELEPGVIARVRAAGVVTCRWAFPLN